MATLNKKTLAIVEHIDGLTGYSVEQFSTKGHRPLSYFTLDIYKMAEFYKIDLNNLKNIIQRVSNQYKKFTVAENGGFGLAIRFIKKTV